MNVLLNENLPPALAADLNTFGWNTMHVKKLGLLGATDHTIVSYAEQHDFVIFTHDLDYGRLVSLSGKSKPSVVTLRLKKINTTILFQLMLRNRTQIEKILCEPCLLVVTDRDLRYKRLPISRI